MSSKHNSLNIHAYGANHQLREKYLVKGVNERTIFEF